jgi:hypothetical protein
MIQASLATHFRGGMITWKPVNSNLNLATASTIDVLFTKRFYWKREAACKANSLIGEGTLVFPDVNNNIDMLINCNEENVVDDWYGGEATKIVKLKKTRPILEASFTGGNWISSLVGFIIPNFIYLT